MIEFLNRRNVAGSGFKSTDAYYYGLFSASIKLPPVAYTAGVVVAFYVSSDKEEGRFLLFTHTCRSMDGKLRCLSF